MLVLLGACLAHGQSGNPVAAGLLVAAPASCLPNRDMYIATDEAEGHKLKLCNATGNGWDDVGSGGSSGSVPAGSIVFISSGTCSAGWAEASELSGKTVIGTVAANGDVGTTGGADSVTPAVNSLTAAAQTFTGSSAITSAVTGGTPVGTVAWPVSVPTFAGSALGTHAHELPWQIPSTTTIRQIAVATFGTGTSRAATAVSAAGTANTTSAAVALSQAVSAGTPAGTVAWPASVPTFTGNALGTHTHTLAATGTNSTSAVTGTLNSVDNRSAFVKLIACKKT
jgi:hypothetical protein